jgi:hypothetical protein
MNLSGGFFISLIVVLEVGRLLHGDDHGEATCPPVSTQEMPPMTTPESVTTIPRTSVRVERVEMGEVG